MTNNDSKSYLPDLNKLVDQYSNTYHQSIKKNLLMLIILLWLTKLKQIIKLLSLELIIEPESQSIRICLVKVRLKTGQEKYLLSILFWERTLDIQNYGFKRRKNNRKFLWKKIVIEFIINELLSRTRQSY